MALNTIDRLTLKGDYDVYKFDNALFVEWLGREAARRRVFPNANSSKKQTGKAGNQREPQKGTRYRLTISSSLRGV